MKSAIKYYLFLFILVYSHLAFSKTNTIANIRIADKDNNTTTRIVLDLSSKTAYSVFTLDKEPRLVIDLEANTYKKITNFKSNIIKKIRVNNNEKGVIRLVFDLKEKVFIEKNFYLGKNKNGLYRLVIDIKYKKKNEQKIIVKKKEKKPFTLTIDAGHGGIDPGAVRYSFKEKDITLLAAKELKNLLTNKGFRVYLTRNKDIFISLRKRRLIAKKNKSDLFISLHIDSVRKKSTRGTSVYTLSDKASDKVTERLAERENKVDLIAGIDSSNLDNEVFSILLDLQRRDTKNSSSQFAEIYVKKIKDHGYRALKRPHRHAGFAVLKSPDIPSVLIELGFLSNPKDAKYLSNKKSRMRVLKALAEAIVSYAKIRSNI